MSFADIEISRRDGKPASFYLFSFGFAPEDRYCYTDAELPQVINGDTYVPVAIDRDDIIASGTLDKSVLSVTMAHVTDVAEVFRVFPPSYVMSLVIYQAHVNDTERQFLAQWSGRVIGSSKKGSEVTLTAEPISSMMRRPGLRRNYQRGCPHAVYQRQCRAPKIAFEKTITAIFIRNIITVSPFTENPLWFAGGFLEWTSPKGRREIYTISSASSDGSLQLLGTTSGMSVGTVLRLFRGCDHTLGALGCGMHNNVQNYGGQPWIPIANPVNSTSVF